VSQDEFHLSRSDLVFRDVFDVLVIPVELQQLWLRSDPPFDQLRFLSLYCCSTSFTASATLMPAGICLNSE
jgi:hypothetical protein